ncbi:MAG: prolipoprotein diacylglyceryl transferase [Armatimonadetes bacterium]|nr:prolipoprotein diacylglyceryl transferase [Armatimonadota bacterium]
MNPILVEFGPITIRWYGVMMALTILTGTAIAYRFGPRFGIPREVLDRFTIPFIVSAVVGARAGYVLSHLSEFPHPVLVLRIDRGGLSSHGAIVAGLLYIAYFARTRNVSAWALADAVAPSIPVGNIFVRFGNFMNGELYGDPTALPWGVRFPTAPDAPRHPLQIYEMVIGAAILALCFRWAARRPFEGALFWRVILWTSVGRIALDALRAYAQSIGPLTMGQVAAAALIAAALVALARGRTSNPSP